MHQTPSSVRLIASKLACLFVAAVAILSLGACAPGTDGIDLVDGVGAFEEGNPLNARLASLQGPIEIAVPKVPQIGLPDLSETSSFAALMQERMRDLATAPVTGFDLAVERCEARKGQLVFSGNESSGIYGDDLGFNPAPFDFEIAEDGSGTYVTQASAAAVFSLRTNGDGSGTMLDKGSQRHLSVHVRPDRSGEYYLKEARTVTTVETVSDGSGVYTRDDPLAKTKVTVTINADGSGELFSLGETDRLTVSALSSGAGEMFRNHNGQVETVLVREDGSWEFLATSPDGERRLIVNADGSGEYSQRGKIFEDSYVLPFEADGSSVGPDVNVPEAPRFVVAERFAPLGQLAALAPQCAKVIRFDSQLLFEVNSSTLKPEADEALRDAVRVLAGSDRAVSINGHTDATGSEEYNQELSEARAIAVRDALVERGLDVETEVNGFGESQPIAPNYDEDGNDDEAGQALNRRVEVVISED